ncbi:hypothetical protein Barb4_00719 [Bacteroidales bacterium Barb4]|nr:hypothetical protein Barb4_00719 [Bacteroidales bacterium Barb4]
MLNAQQVVMIDIKQTAEGDIDFSTGDLLYAESTGQHQGDRCWRGKDITRVFLNTACTA